MARYIECAGCRYLPCCHGGCPAVSILTSSGPLGRDGSSCLFFGEHYYEKIKAALPGYRDLSPMPEKMLSDG